MKFSQYQSEMAPFFGYNGGEGFDQFCFIAVALYEGDTGSGGLLFTKSMIGEDLLKGNPGQVDPSWIGWQLQTQYIAGVLG